MTTYYSSFKRPTTTVLFAHLAYFFLVNNNIHRISLEKVNTQQQNYHNLTPMMNKVEKQVC